MERHRVFRWTVPEGTKPVRLSDYIHRAFHGLLTRKGGKKAIKRGLITVNDQLGNTAYWVKPGDVIEYRPDEANRPKPYKLDLEIVYEDAYLAVVHKPAGIVVSGNQFRTVQNALLHNFNDSSEEDALPWPLPTHRLDLQTSGLLLVAKTQRARVALGHAFAQREITKKYHAVCEGAVPDQGVISDPINGKPSQTIYSCLSRSRSLHCEWVSLVKLHPHTGRKHQLRIHMSRLGFPIVGDKLYAKGQTLKGKGLFLVATELSFKHPINSEGLTFKIDLPKKLIKYLHREETLWNRANA